MSRRRLATLAVLGLSLMTVLGAPVAQAGDRCLHDLTRPAPTTGAAAQVAIGECTFEPTVSHVAVGSLVTWTNTSPQPHEVLGANLAWGAHQKLLETGDSIGWTFDRPGVYPYTCLLHPGMTGAIVVGAVAASEPSDDATVAAAAPVSEPPPGSPVLAPLALLAAGLAAGALVALAWVSGSRRRSPVA